MITEQTLRHRCDDGNNSGCTTSHDSESVTVLADGKVYVYRERSFLLRRQLQV